MPVANAAVTVVVVTYRGTDRLPSCLAGLRTQTVAHQLLIIDNASADGTSELLSTWVVAATDRTVRLDHNTGFAGGVAAALPLVSTRFCALLNDDAVPDPDWLECLLRVARDDDDAARMDFVDGAGRCAGRGQQLGRRHPLARNRVGAGAAVGDIVLRTAEVFGFCGGAARLRTDAVRAVGGFPHRFFSTTRIRTPHGGCGSPVGRSASSRMRGWYTGTRPPRIADQSSSTSYNERNRFLTLIRWSGVGGTCAIRPFRDRHRITCEDGCSAGRCQTPQTPVSRCGCGCWRRC